MIFVPKRSNKLTQTIYSLNFSSQSPKPSHEIEIETNRITKLINNHPFPNHPLHPTLINHITPSLLTTPLVENVLGRLFSGHSNGLKAYEFFKFSLQHSCLFRPTSDAFEKTLHILIRMRNFDKAWDLFKEIKQVDSSLLTLKSMSIVLAKYTKFRSFDDTLEVFDKMEKEIFVDKVFGVDEFNVLLRAFSTQKKMMEARAVFRKMYSRFSANTQTLNILLLGFKESGNVTAVELFYHEMVRRGFKPNVVTYNIRIDAYCKKGCFGDGLRLKEEMERLNYLPTLETMTTLIHGACVARNVFGARGLFDEISLRRLNPDAGAYNALISSSFRVGDVKSAMGLMDEMDEKSIGHDNVTYHTMFMGLKRWSGNESVYRLYERMVKSNFVPKARTVVMLMKFFCENQRADLGLDLWRYMLEKGCCLHGHAVDVLLTGLCCVGKVEAAYECSIQVLERGRPLTEVGFGVMEKFLMQTGKTDELRKLDQMMKRLQNVLPPSRGQAIGLPASTTVK